MRVASANSGRPESPPASFAIVRSRRVVGRASVVLPTIMPSTRCRRATPTTSSSSVRVRSGAILISTGVGAGAAAHARRAHPRRARADRRTLRLLQVAQAGRVGRGNVDGEIARDRRERLDQAHIVGDAVGGLLVGADIDADDAARVRRARKPAQHRLGALAVEAEPVDHALVGGEPEQARARIARLRLRRHGADLDEAEAEPEQRIGHLGVLVEPGRHADRIGEVEPEGPHREPRVVGASSRRAPA